MTHTQPPNIVIKILNSTWSKYTQNCGVIFSKCSIFFSSYARIAWFCTYTKNVAIQVSNYANATAWETSKKCEKYWLMAVKQKMYKYNRPKQCKCMWILMLKSTKKGRKEPKQLTRREKKIMKVNWLLSHLSHIEYRTE